MRLPYRRGRRLLAPFLVALCAGLGGAAASHGAVPAQATVHCTLVASPTGSDRRSGKPSAPVRTVARLVARLKPGQTGCLAAGARFDEDVTVRRAGRPDARITLASADPQQPATLQGRLVFARGADYWSVSFLHLDGRNGPSPTIGSTGIVLAANDITDDHTGICVHTIDSERWGTARGTTIVGNRIHDCGRLPATGHDHGIYDMGFDTAITDNLVYGNADRGVQLRGAHGAKVFYNVIVGNGEGVLFGDLGASDNEVANNLIGDATQRYNVESWWGEGPVGSGNSAHDNCVWGGRQGSIERENGFVASRNVVATPVFTNAGAGDFTLAAGSPCADKGPRAAVLRDLLAGAPGAAVIPDFRVRMSIRNNARLRRPLVWTVEAVGVETSAVAGVDFVVDGRVRWHERFAPYRYAGDAGRLDPRRLRVGTHRLEIRLAAIDGTVHRLRARVVVARR